MNVKQDKIIAHQESVISKIEYQNLMIAETIHKSIDDRFNN
jgi:hypothetical protein